MLYKDLYKKFNERISKNINRSTGAQHQVTYTSLDQRKFVWEDMSLRNEN